MNRPPRRLSRALRLPLVLCAVLAACGGEPGDGGEPGMVGALRSAERVKARTQMRLFDTCLKRYVLENAHLPDTLEDLMEPGPASSAPCLARVPLDPWGNAYDYQPIDDREYTIASWGPDGTEGTADDIFWPQDG